MWASASLLMATMVRAPFIPTRCWMAPEDAERQVQPGRHGLSRAADLPIHRQPARIADGPRGSSSALSARASSCASGRCSWALMPRPTATIRSACPRSMACFDSWNGGSGRWRWRPGRQSPRPPASGPGSRRGALHPPGRRRSGAGRSAVLALRARHRPRTCLEHGPDEWPPRLRAASRRCSPAMSPRPSRAASCGAKSRARGRYAAAARPPGSPPRPPGPGLDEAVRRIRFEPGILDDEHRADLGVRQLAGHLADGGAGHARRSRGRQAAGPPQSPPSSPG